MHCAMQTDRQNYSLDNLDSVNNGVAWCQQVRQAAAIPAGVDHTPFGLSSTEQHTFKVGKETQHNHQKAHLQECLDGKAGSMLDSHSTTSSPPSRLLVGRSARIGNGVARRVQNFGFEVESR